MYPESGATHKYQPKWLDRMKEKERDVGGAVSSPSDSSQMQGNVPVSSIVIPANENGEQ